MSLELTLALLAVALAFCGLSLWQVRRKREPGKPLPLVDWHYPLFISILAAIVLLVHALKEWQGG